MRIRFSQTALRHRSIETAEDSCSYIEAGEATTRADNVFDADGVCDAD